MTTTTTDAIRPGQAVIAQTLYDGPQHGIVQAQECGLVMVTFAESVRFTPRGQRSAWCWLPRKRAEVTE